MLRDFIRSVIFEHFPLSAGVCAGVAQALLVAWGIAVATGLETVPLGPLAALAAVLAVAQGWATPRISVARLRSPAARALAQLYLAVGLATIAVAAALVAYAGVVGGVAGLLAAAGVPEDPGGTLRAGSVALALAVAGALAWGFWDGPRRLEVTRRRVPLRGLDPALRGTRIAHLSDLHIGNGLEGARLEALVARVNALEPDLVAITGDLFDHDPAALDDGARALAGLRAPLGVYAVLGNHDLFTGRDAVAAALAAHAPGLRLLRGDCLRLPAPPALYVAGFDDPGHDWTAHRKGLPAIEKLAAAVPNDGPAILLSHRPDAFPQAAALGFALVLAGHYHGGQVALPGRAERWNVASLLTPFHRGEYRRGDALLYVSRGLGFAGPRIRLASSPEIALLELDAAKGARDRS